VRHRLDTTSIDRLQLFDEREYALQLRQDFLDWFAVILQVYYQNDGNQTHLVKAPDGTSVREFNHPNQIGFNLTLQARY